MAEKSKKATTSKRKKSSVPKKSRKRNRNKRQHFEKFDFPYAATEYDCQLCEYYGGHDSKGRINCLSERCRMLKHFNDFSIDDDEDNRIAEDDNNDDWDDEYDDLADLFI